MPESWKNDFPVTSDEESYVARREFMKFTALTSLAFFLGTVTATARKLLRRDLWKNASGMCIAKTEEIAVGGHKLFRYPTDEDPCILVRLSEDKFAAFDQRCTHLTCPVYFAPEDQQLLCPCHKGIFSAADGSVVAGPPKRGLNALAVSVRDGQVWVRFPETENI
jgi:nitrite reductase/ring-hydroxylating ferredoxin subunit